MSPQRPTLEKFKENNLFEIPFELEEKIIHSRQVSSEALLEQVQKLPASDVDLPTEILILVLSYLAKRSQKGWNRKDLYHCALVNKR